MAHPKINTAPPKEQLGDSARSLGMLIGFTYYEVQVLFKAEGLRQTFPGLQSESLAGEFRSILEPVFAPNPVRIVWAAGQEEEAPGFLLAESRLTDMIMSVRTADQPGRELLARLGYFGPYEGLAPQNSDAPVCGAGGAAC